MTSTNQYATLPGGSTFLSTVDNDVSYNGVLRITATDLGVTRESRPSGAAERLFGL